VRFMFIHNLHLFTTSSVLKLSLRAGGVCVVCSLIESLISCFVCCYAGSIVCLVGKLLGLVVGLLAGWLASCRSAGGLASVGLCRFVWWVGGYLLLLPGWVPGLVGWLAELVAEEQG